MLLFKRLNHTESQTVEPGTSANPSDVPDRSGGGQVANGHCNPVLKKLLLVLVVFAGIAFLVIKLFDVLDNFDASVAAPTAQ